jgi:integrase
VRAGQPDRAATAVEIPQERRLPRYPLPQYVADAIEAHIAEHGTTTGGYLFKGRKKTLVVRRTYQEDFARSAAKAGLPESFTPHSLRHCFASTALAGGIPITEVSRWLGHKSIEITIRSTATWSRAPGTAPATYSRPPTKPARPGHESLEDPARYR